MSNELRYEISDWHQLRSAKSNNSDQLYISVGDIVQNDTLTGLRIQILHRTLGVIFAYIRNATGDIVTVDNSINTENVDDNTLIAELAKYGFLITYTYPQKLPADQLEFLITLRNLKFDKLRILPVWHFKDSEKVWDNYIVVFRVEDNPKWLSNTYGASRTEYTNALQHGSVFNISATATTQSWDWSWLDFVANIDDIIQENSQS